jgi:hypothetical protein
VTKENQATSVRRSVSRQRGSRRLAALADFPASFSCVAADTFEICWRRSCPASPDWVTKLDPSERARPPFSNGSVQDRELARNHGSFSTPED